MVENFYHNIFYVLYMVDTQRWRCPKRPVGKHILSIRSQFVENFWNIKLQQWVSNIVGNSTS